MTPDQCFAKAAEILEMAAMEPVPEMVAAKVAIAEAWVTLAAATAEVTT